MALIKEIKQDDGIVTKYHRILSIRKTINRQNSITVLSYVDGEARANEQKAETAASVYRKSVTFETDYNPDMTVEAAYTYLKTRPQFEGAEDDI